MPLNSNSSVFDSPGSATWLRSTRFSAAAVRGRMPMFRVVTVSAEYGSGAGSIARTIAQKLGWNLLDKALVGQIARAARVDPALAQRYDENVDSWLHRV